MKKVIAVLAASAVAVSMFAFAGCKDNDDKKTDSGAIPGGKDSRRNGWYP